MAQLSGPLFSLGASGSVGDLITYTERSGRSIATRWHKPTGAPSAKQLAVRQAVSFLSDLWTRTPSGFQSPFTRLADHRPTTGRALFMQENIPGLAFASNLTDLKVASVHGKGIPGIGVVITPATFSINVAIDPPSLPVGWSIYYSITRTFRNRDPHLFPVEEKASKLDSTAPYNVTVGGLLSATSYFVCTYFTYADPYGRVVEGPQNGTTVVTL